MWDAIAAIAGTVGVLVTGGGLWFVACQIKDARSANKAQFISNLESEFTALSDVYYNLLPGEIWSSECEGPTTLKERAIIISYLTFFGKLEYLINLKILDVSTLDQLFAFRFFLVTNNIHTQQQILYSDTYKGYWMAVYRLHWRWSEFRRNEGLEIPFEDKAMLKYDVLKESDRKQLKS